MKREQKALELIRKSLQKHDNPVLACSFGKDSIVVLHLLKQITDDFQVLFNDTKVAYPDTYNIKDKLEAEWDLDIVTTRAEKSFWDIVDEYGYPGIISSDRSDKAMSSCCYHLKKKPTKKAIQDNDWDLYFDGLTAYESDRRYLNLKEYGLYHHHKTFDLYKAHPIGWWTVDDVWDYIEKYNIPYPDIYDNEVDCYTKRGYSEQICGHQVDRAIRNGCWCCTVAIKQEPGKMKQLRKYYPKLWRGLMKSGLAEVIAEIKLGGQGDLIHGYFTEETRDQWLERRPCFFDQT